MTWYGRPTDKEVEMVFCGQLYKKESYNIIEVETTMIHSFRTFKNEDEYDAFCDERDAVRNGYNEIKTAEHSAYKTRAPVMSEVVTALRTSKLDWNKLARKFVETWGVENVPEAMRYAIDMMLEEETCGYRWLKWPPLNRHMSGYLEGTKIHWYNVDLQQWKGVTKEHILGG